MHNISYKINPDVLNEKTKQALNSIKKHKNFTQLQRAKKKKMYIRKC